MNLRKQVSDELVKRGFTRDGRSHLLRINDDFALIVDTGPIGKRSDIAPFVGLRSEAIERLMAQFMGVSEDAFVATVGANVGYVLGGGYRFWEPPENAMVVLCEIEKAVDKLRHFANLEQLPELWKVPAVGGEPLQLYREIVLHAIRHNDDSLTDAIKRASVQYCMHDDEICAQYHHFEAAVRRWIGGGGSSSEG